MSSSRNKKRATLNERLDRLRTITNSKATNEDSIVEDASKYIEDLKHKVESLNHETGTTSRMSQPKNDLPKVKVKTLQKGFRIKVLLDKNCPGLLISILEAFENLGLEVLDARVSCTDTFQLEAVGENGDNINAQMVKQTILQAIQTWSDQD